MSVMTDDFTAARRAMVLNQLRPQGVTNGSVLAAMGTVPRENFVPPAMRAMAYADRSLIVDSGAPMMPPAELGILLTALDPQPGERALVIGKGGRYSAAILEALGLQVTTAGATAPTERGPFDVVLIEGAVERFPEWVAKLLSPDGRVGAALRDRGIARLSIGRGERQSIGFKSLADAQVPPLPGFEAKPQFVF